MRKFQPVPGLSREQEEAAVRNLVTTHAYSHIDGMQPAFSLLTQLEQVKFAGAGEDQVAIGTRAEPETIQERETVSQGQTKSNQAEITLPSKRSSTFQYHALRRGNAGLPGLFCQCSE